MKQFYKSVVLSLCLFVLPFTAHASDDKEAPMLISTYRLSMETALRIAQASLHACRKAGVQVSVVVVDRSGDPQVVLRDVLAANLTLEISQKKAYTAMVFNRPTIAMRDLFPGSYSVPKIERLLMAGGGYPITAGGKILGGIGVSGAPSEETDSNCAKAGIDAISDDLEMSITD